MANIWAIWKASFVGEYNFESFPEKIFRLFLIGNFIVVFETGSEMQEKCLGQIAEEKIEWYFVHVA